MELDTDLEQFPMHLCHRKARRDKVLRRSVRVAFLKNARWSIWRGTSALSPSSSRVATRSAVCASS